MTRLLSLSVLAVMALEVAHLYLGLPGLRAAAHLAMAAVVVTCIPRMGLREVYLLSLSAVLVGLLWAFHPDPWLAGRRALDQAVFLMSFILLVSLVQEAAMTSPAVREVGTWLSRQPGGRRFVGLYSGSMVMGVVFNLGSVTLLAPLIRRAAEAFPDDPLTPIRERRQLSSVLRGFAWCVVWSPTAVAPLALMGLIEGIDRPRWMVLGVGLSLIMLAVGWAEDRVAWRRYTAAARGLPPVERAPMPGRAVARFAAVSGLLMGLTVAVIWSTGQGVPAALMIASPATLVVWLAAQSRPLGHEIRRIVAEGLPASAPTAVTLACSGFVGIAGAALIPADAVADGLGFDALPAWVFMLGVTLAVTLLSQFALSPIMMAVFFGAILGQLPSLPAEPTLTALAIAAGWSVSTTISPFASGVMLLSRITGHPGTRLTYGWNAGFTALSVLVLAAAYWLMTGGR